MTEKTLADVKRDMSSLYDNLVSGSVELKTAAEAANIAGKWLKADQLQLARAMFLNELGHKIDTTSSALESKA